MRSAGLARSGAVLAVVGMLVAGCSSGTTPAPTAAAPAVSSAPASAAASAATTSSAPAASGAAASGTTASAAPLGSPPAAITNPSVSALNIGWGANDNPTAVLKQQGWLQQEMGSVPVKWTQFDSGARMVSALVSHSVDISCEAGSPPIAAAAATGIPVRIIWINENAAEALAVNPQKITSWADVPGQKFGTIVGSTMWYSLVAAIQGNNIPLNKVTILDGPQPDDAAAYKRGDLAGVYLSNPWLGQVEAAGAKILITSDQVAQQYHLATFDACIALAPWLDAHQDVAKAFVAAMDYATRYFYADPQGTYQALSQALNITPAQAQQQAAFGHHPDAAEIATSTWLGTPSTAASSGVTQAMKLTIQYGTQLGRLDKSKIPANFDPATIGDPRFVDAVAGVQ